MEYIFLFLGLAIIWAIWQASRPLSQYTFIVRITAGRVEAIHGKVTPAFLERIREVVAQGGIQSGEIRGIWVARLIRLRFTREFSNEAAQQLRNWWSLHGWRRR